MSRAPVTVVKGGTLSSSEDTYIKAFVADTKERLATRDAERSIAMKGQLSPDEQGGAGFAAEKVADLGQPGTSAVSFVGYKTGVGDEVVYMQLDVTMASDQHGNLDPTFVFVCPRCVARGYPSTMSQVHVRNSNRKWYLDTKCQGETFFDELDGRVYTLAGKVYCEERCRCPRSSCDGVFIFGDWSPNDINARPHTTCMRRA
jgi:hypothetical protein